MPMSLRGEQRRPRAQVSYFSSLQLVDAWQAIAEKRSPGFSWDGTSYPKGKRGLGVDRDALLQHHAPLEPLIRLAGSAFPAHGNLRLALEHLHARHNVFDKSSFEPFKCANDAADRWRIMAKDVGRLAGSDDPEMHPKLAALDQLTKGGLTFREPCGHSPRPAQPCDQPSGHASSHATTLLRTPVPSVSPGEPFPSLEGIDGEAIDGETCSSDDAELVSAYCMCADCVAARPEHGTIMVDSEEEAAHIPVPSAIKGGQRKQTDEQAEPAAAAEPGQAHKRRRIVTKRAPPTGKARENIEEPSGPAQVNVVHRQGGQTAKCAYVMVNRQYMVGCGLKKSSSYLQHIKNIASQYRTGVLKSKADGRVALERLRSAERG